MKCKYDYREEKAKIEKKPDYTLPEDINEPVIKYLKEIGCDVGIKIIKDFQRHVNKGCITLCDEKAPNAHIEINMSYGMVMDYKKHSEIKDGRWTAYISKRMKNAYLNTKSENKKGGG